MEFQLDERRSHLNKTTGEVLAANDKALQAAEENLPREDFPEWQ